MLAILILPGLTMLSKLFAAPTGILFTPTYDVAVTRRKQPKISRKASSHA